MFTCHNLHCFKFAQSGELLDLLLPSTLRCKGLSVEGERFRMQANWIKLDLGNTGKSVDAIAFQLAISASRDVGQDPIERDFMWIFSDPKNPLL